MSGTTQVLSDDLLHFGENRYNTLPSGLDKQLAVRIAPNVLPKEVETFFYVRDQGLFRRKDQTTFSQKGFDQRLHRHSQQLFRVSGDDEVVRITDQMYLRCSTAIGAFSAYRKNFPEPAFEAVERDVSQHRRYDSALRCARDRIVEYLSF